MKATAIWVRKAARSPIIPVVGGCWAPVPRTESENFVKTLRSRVLLFFFGWSRKVSASRRQTENNKLRHIFRYVTAMSWVEWLFVCVVWSPKTWSNEKNPIVIDFLPPTNTIVVIFLAFHSIWCCVQRFHVYTFHQRQNTVWHFTDALAWLGKLPEIEFHAQFSHQRKVFDRITGIPTAYGATQRSWASKMDASCVRV